MNRLFVSSIILAVVVVTALKFSHEYTACQVEKVDIVHRSIYYFGDYYTYFTEGESGKLEERRFTADSDIKLTIKKISQEIPLALRFRDCHFNFEEFAYQYTNIEADIHSENDIKAGIYMRESYE